MNELRPFHLACPVSDLQKARDFYKNTLGCEEGRSDNTWVDFNFFGHQLVFHLDASNKATKEIINPVDAHGVPVPHFGVVLTFNDWNNLVQRLEKANIEFVIKPYIRFQGGSVLNSVSNSFLG